VLPIISVCPVKRPKLDSTGNKYSFKQEREMMSDKIRIALRIAVYYGYPNICIGRFGLGPGFRNPPEEVASMWKDAFLSDPEFVGHFHNIVFAFEPEISPTSSTDKSSSADTSSKVTKMRSNPTSDKDIDVFRNVFNPSNIHGAFKP
jgi:uncharacterized protein (TIGR02452 family)